MLAMCAEIEEIEYRAGNDARFQASFESQEDVISAAQDSSSVAGTPAFREPRRRYSLLLGDDEVSSTFQCMCGPEECVFRVVQRHKT